MTIETMSSIDWQEFDRLLSESASQGFAFLKRFRYDWESGLNRFNARGEGLFCARSGGRLIGLCGLNADPFVSDPRIGRLRHVYVLERYRRRGAGEALVHHALQSARPHFDLITLRTDMPSAAAFFEALGFVRVTGQPSTTHWFRLAWLTTKPCRLFELHREKRSGWPAVNRTENR